MDAQELDEALLELSAKPEYGDIRSARASNGELYLYSAQFLTQAHAESLIEWMAVGIAENP